MHFNVANYSTNPHPQVSANSNGCISAARCSVRLKDAPEDGAMLLHYHIHWSDSKFDWQVLNTPEDARTEADRLARPGETYTIESFTDDCPPCKAVQLERLQHKQSGKTPLTR